MLGAYFPFEIKYSPTWLDILLATIYLQLFVVTGHKFPVFIPEFS